MRFKFKQTCLLRDVDANSKQVESKKRTKMKSPHTGIKRIFHAFFYSVEGFKAAFKSEAAFRQDLLLCALLSGVLVALEFYAPLSLAELLLLVFTMFFLLFAELTNTAIEVCIDRIGAEYHELSKKAKDIGSLLVLLALIFMAVCWICVLVRAFA